MAYAAVISLKQTIDRLLNSSQISIVPPSKKFLKSAYKQVQSLQEVLKRFDSSSSSNNERVNALDDAITETIYKFEDVIESHVSNQFLSQYEQSHNEDHEISHPLIVSIDMEEVKQEIVSFGETIKKMEDEYINELNSSARAKYDVILSRIGYGGKKKLVGLSDQFQEIQTQLLDLTDPYYYTCVSLVGMAGIGKTTLATKIFEDPLISSHFDCRAFVTVGQKYELKEILQSILAQLMNIKIDKLMLNEGDLSLDDLKRMMYPNLKGKRYFIVLDDVWSKQVWDDLRRLLPNNRNRSRILLTTRLQQVATSVNIFEIRLLNKEESWDLLREKVFDEDALCPPQLVKDGKKIAENCEGLPLLIVTVAKLLSEADKKPKYWNEVANKENSAFMDANDQILKVLFSSYEYLPQYLKACFLYMGVFPQNYEIPRSKLIKLWSAEGLFEPIAPSITVESFSTVCLEELVSKSLVTTRQKRSVTSYRSLVNNTKTCGLHSVVWHLCNREAEKNKFSHVVSSSAEGTEHHRRLCIQNNVLFAIKGVNKSIASISHTHSLLCFGPYHKYPLPICLDHLRLLRVLDTLTIRLYEFPVEVLKLVHLRYLALTYDGNLAPSISKLRNLQFLIILRHLSIVKSCVNSSYLPKEIWDMQELKHLQIMGSNLTDPCGAILPNLLTLLDVSPHCCTKKLLERIPRLRKLGIRFDLVSDADAKSLNWFDLTYDLHLISLKCVVLNPIPWSEVAVPPAPLPINIYSSVGKLSLSGFGYPWEYMKLFASLPRLEVLKLRCYAFRGAKWETQDKAFRWLKVLVIEDSDLVQWTAGFKTFRCLEHLTLENCHKLERIPRDFGESIRLIIELVDCNTSVVACAKQMQEEQRNKERYFPKVSVHYSWNDVNFN